ncbi:DUF402 domain-containing protein [Nocardioides zeae]|uniref:DUF402 domain-containing protein n=1 Tax=Nocardioides imazamoxiresistens TaxID=3231893 RepID=A0ABU3PYR8_9ACTN|nr:DUF402 domain-containing protein [Nocardioides zeae]MDT9593952.1 DUF402 domain-containing protein [Nocardioides zeae]
MSTLEPGTPVVVAMTKHDGRRHWGYEARFLGSDVHGDWIGVPAGTHHARPGLEFDSAVATVALVPADGAYAFPAVNAPGLWCDVYVDMATPPAWDLSGPVPVVRSVDLDLDVIRLEDGTVLVDDEDEFAAHRVEMDYPPALVAHAEAACAQVVAAVRAGAAPFDGPTAERWFAVLDGLDGP